MRIRPLILWALAASLAAPSCTPDFSGLDGKTSCLQNTDCLPGRVCLQNRCIDPTRPPVGTEGGGDLGGPGDVAAVGGGFGDDGVADQGGGSDQGGQGGGAEGDEGGAEADLGGGAGVQGDPGGDAGQGDSGNPGGEGGEGGEGGGAEAGGVAGQAGPGGDGGQPPPAGPEVGDVVITEIMVNPGGAHQVQDDDGEWIEIQNLTERHFSLNGWSIQDDGSPRSFAFPERGLLEALSTIVVARSGDRAINGGVTADYITGDAHRLANEGDRIQLFGPSGELLDEVSWSTPMWPVHPGAAMSLDIEARDPRLNDDPAHWCPSSAGIVAGGDRGSPGRDNPSCPAAPPANCSEGIDVSAGGLFGWDLALSHGGLLSDHAYLGRCDNPGVEDPYTIGLGSPDAVFKFSAPFDARWRFELQSTRVDADLAMYIWADGCPRLSAEACADALEDEDGVIDQGRALIERQFAGGHTYFLIVDGATSQDGAVSPQPFTLDVTPDDQL